MESIDVFAQNGIAPGAPVDGQGVGGQGVDGLPALTRFARRAAGADLVITFEAGEDGLAVPLACDPPLAFAPFALGSTRIESVDWSGGTLPADALNLPSSIVAALEAPPREAMFLSAPAVEAERSGIVFLWLANAPARCDCVFRSGMRDQIGLLAPVFAQMVNDRLALNRRLTAHERFHDLFGSVPMGIVVLEGNGQSGLVNEAAAKLLDVPAGELPVFEIAVPMRNLRARCRNAAALDVQYAPMQGDIDYAVTTTWDLGDEKLEVDTHPVLGNGRNGRIWLFQNVTAHHEVEDRLRAQAWTDALTGLNNRRHFTEIAASLFAVPADADQPLAALMVDIDHFKRVNDEYGHQTGDVVLRAVSSRMRGALRESDLIGRLGGEEFAVLLHGLTLADAIDTAERLRTAIGASPIATNAATLEVRVSIGVAERTAADTDLDALLARADRALYAAKNGGRDRVAVDAG
jgi:diguanylate cyclase (GGDEF)-like protein